MLQLRFTIDGNERILPLRAAEVRCGRSSDNEIVLPDYSVSRHHAVVRRAGDSWAIHDLGSTNGVEINLATVESSELRAGDRLKIGIFELQVEEAQEPAAGGGGPVGDFAAPKTDPSMLRRATVPEASGVGVLRPVAPTTAAKDEAALSNATIIRSLADISADFGLDQAASPGDSGFVRQSKREALDQAYASQVFGFLTKLARTLITTDSDDEILEHVMAIAFEILPVDRGFILLTDEKTGELGCELVRIRDRVELRPTGEVPISKTMLRAVMRQRVALLTVDALSDQRLAGRASVRIHQIRAAMCTPLWSGEKIFGVMQVDTPHHTGSFTEPDVDLLATLANYCAVALERNRHAREAAYQREVRARLERYHSPAVIEEMMTDAAAGGRRLRQAEVSVLYADIVGFTAFSEKARPEEVAELMESYFTHAVEAIFAAGGTLDKFIGDCVMAFFGAPMAQPDHAYRAVQAAIRICDALEGWNAERRRQGLVEIQNRIGINSGPVVVGDIGSNRRVDYTVLGNTVNVASRLEESARPGDIFVGPVTHRQLDGKVPTEHLGEMQLKGLSRRITVYRVVRR